MAVRAAPQSPQNRWLGALSAPHCRQRFSRGAPQSPQNFWCSGLSALHFEQRIETLGRSILSKSAGTRPARSGVTRPDYAQVSGKGQIALWSKEPYSRRGRSQGRAALAAEFFPQAQQRRRIPGTEPGAQNRIACRISAPLDCQPRTLRSAWGYRAPRSKDGPD